MNKKIVFQVSVVLTLIYVIVCSIIVNDLHAAQVLYGYHVDGPVDNGFIYSIDVTTGAETFIGQSMAFSFFGSYISNPYGYSYPTIWEYNPASGSWRDACTSCLAFSPLSFAYDGAMLYALDNHLNIHKVNPDDWSSTLIRSNTDLIDLTFHDGTIYGIEDFSGRLYEIDPNTGQQALIGSGTYNIFSITVVNGVMYGSGGPNLVSIDMTNGQQTIISNSMKSRLIATGNISVAPEPISFVLFITGGTLLAGRAYVNKRSRT